MLFEEQGQQIEENQSAGAQIINKKIQSFEAAKKRPENLKKIYRSLLTIRPTSVEPELAFSAVALFASKIRIRLSDDTFNAMIVMLQFYKKHQSISCKYFLMLSFFKPVRPSNSLNAFRDCS